MKITGITLSLVLALAAVAWPVEAEPNTEHDTAATGPASLSNELERIRKEGDAMRKRQQERQKILAEIRSRKRQGNRGIVEAKSEGKVIVNTTTNAPIATSKGVEFKFQWGRNSGSRRGGGMNSLPSGPPDTMSRAGMFVK